MEKSVGYAAAGVDPRETSALVSAHDVLSNARDLASRVEALASKLLGPVPEQADNAGIKGGPSGLFGGLKESAENTQRYLDDANAAISRIERAL